MDLSSLNTRTLSEEGVWMTLRNPDTSYDVLDEKGEPVRFRLIGKDSRAYRRKRNEVVAEIRNRTGNRREVSLEDLEASERRSLEIVAACIVEHDPITFNGKPVDLTKTKTALDVLSDPGNAFLVEQLDGFIHNRGNFLPTPSAPSESGPDGSPGSSKSKMTGAASGSTT